MRRIIFAVFLLELITILECRSLIHKCSTSVGNFTILVCTNRTEIHCSLRRISIPINALTEQERKCIENAGHWGQKSITCTHSQRCHSDDRVAHYISTCATLAVREITPMLPQFATLCCRIKQTLIDLYFAIEKEVFKSLLTPIKTGSLQAVSVKLKLTQWCREFHLNCRKITAILDVGCERLANRKRRNLKNTSPSNQTLKQTNSTSLTGVSQQLSTRLSSTTSRTQETKRTVLQQTIVLSSSLENHRDITKMSSMSASSSEAPLFTRSMENHQKMESRTDSSTIAIPSIGTTYNVKSVETTSVQGVSLIVSMPFPSSNIHQTVSPTRGISPVLFSNSRTLSSKLEQSAAPTPHLPGTSISASSSKEYPNERPLTLNVTFSGGSKSATVTPKPSFQRTLGVSSPTPSLKEHDKERSSTLSVTFLENSKSTVVTSTQASQQNPMSSRTSIVIKQQPSLSEPHSVRSSSWQLSKASLSLSSLPLKSSPPLSASSSLHPSLSMSSLTPYRLLSSSPLSSEPKLTDLSPETNPSFSGTSTISLKDFMSTMDSSLRSGSHSLSVAQSSIKSSTSYQSIDVNNGMVDSITTKVPPSSSSEPLSIEPTVLSSIEEGQVSVQTLQRTLSIVSSSVKDAPTGNVMLTTSDLDRTIRPLSTIKIRSSPLPGSSSSLSSSSMMSSSFSKLSASSMFLRSVTSSIIVSASSRTLVSSLPSVPSSIAMNNTVLSVSSMISPTSLTETAQTPLKTNLENSSTIPQSLMPLPSVAPFNGTSILTKRNVTPYVKETILSSSPIKSMLVPLSSSYPGDISLSMHTKPSETMHLQEETTLSITSQNVTETLTSTLFEMTKSSSSLESLLRTMTIESTSSTSTSSMSANVSVMSSGETNTLSLLSTMSSVESSQSDVLPTVVTDKSVAASPAASYLQKPTVTHWLLSPSPSLSSSLTSSSTSSTSSTSFFSSVKKLSLSLPLSSSSPLSSFQSSNTSISLRLVSSSTSSSSPLSSFASLINTSISSELLSSSSSPPLLSFPSSNTSISLELVSSSSSSSPISSFPSSNASISLQLVSPTSSSPLSSLPSSNISISLRLVSSTSSSSLSSFPSNMSILLSSLSSSAQPSSALSSPPPPSHESPTSLTSVSTSLPLSTSSIVPSTLLTSTVSPMRTASINTILTSWSTTSSPIPTSFLETSSLLLPPIVSSSKAISSTKSSPLPLATSSLQLSTALSPSTIPSVLLPQGVITTSKLQLLAKTTAKLQHSITSSAIGHSTLSTVESREISSYEMASSELKIRTTETDLTGATKVLVGLTKSILAPSKTLTATAIPSIILDYIQTFLIIFDGICPSSSKQEAFKTAFIRTLREHIAIESSSIDIHSIKCGSVKVIFSINCERSSKIPEILEGLVRDGEFNVSMNGSMFKALNITILEVTTQPSLSTTIPTDNPSVSAKVDDGKRAIKIIFILFSAAFGAMALFGTVICIAKSCGRRQFGKLRLNSSTLSTRGTNQLYKNELELVRLSPLHHGADYYGGHVIQPRDDSDDDDKIDNRTVLLNRLRNDEVASRRGKIIIKDDDSYSSIAFY